MLKLITLTSCGALPGIPGSHAPGAYLVDYDARTINDAPTNNDTSGNTEPLPDLDRGSEQPDVIQSDQQINSLLPEKIITQDETDTPAEPQQYS